jgi:hypothetical protein
MMEQRLDDYLAWQDECAIEDGEAVAHSYCWACGFHVPAEAMPPLPEMMCAWCENDLRFVNEFTEQCRAIQERQEKIRAMNLTPEDVWGE